MLSGARMECSGRRRPPCSSTSRDGASLFPATDACVQLAPPRQKGNAPRKQLPRLAFPASAHGAVTLAAAFALENPPGCAAASVAVDMSPSARALTDSSCYSR